LSLAAEVGAVRAADVRAGHRATDSATYSGAVHRAGARFLAAVNTDPKSAVIIAISQQAWKRSATRAI
jgi:hypothetical protein